MIYKIFHALAFTQLFGLIFIFSNLPFPTMQTCDIELFLFCNYIMFYILSLSKIFLFKYDLLFHASVHWSGLNLDVASSESIPEPYLQSEWGTFPLFLGAPKTPCTYILHVSSWYYCHLLVVILHETINSQISRNVPVLFSTKYQANQHSAQNIIDTQNVFDESDSKKEYACTKTRKWINVSYKVFKKWL